MAQGEAMLEGWVVSIGLKLNELTGLETGAGVILLALKDSGKKAHGITYGELRDALQANLGQRLERYGINSPQPIVLALLEYLRDYQSLFTMAAR
jgi:hypothetical protein